MRKVADILRKAGFRAVLALAAPLAGGLSAHAQGLPAVTAGKPGDKLLVEADELIYDNDHGTVTARGNAELHYGPRTLQADRVRYDRTSGRVFAEGNVRLTEADGGVVTGARMELTDDFKTGFVDAFRGQQTVQRKFETVRTRFSAPRAERLNGEQTSFESGSYTACEPCKDNPETPPLWQIKAKKIIHDNETHTVYFDDSTLEIAGIPVAYLPYFEAPDPTVKRKTGFLTPRFITTTALGNGVSLPYFINLAPNYDLTVTPTLLSRQGLLAQGEFRQRIDNGFYNIRLSGISQTTPSAFLPSPLGAGERDFRGSVESQGRFYINPRWRTGWDLVGVTDKWFLDNYRIRNQNITTDYFREATSTAYLIGQGDRSWFEARGYYFKGLSSFDWQKQQPIVAPVIDYDKRVNGPSEIGGEVRFQANITSLTRETTQYQGLPRTSSYLFSPSVNGVSFPLYQTCTVFQRGLCAIDGLAGTNTRASAELSWRRSFIDDWGQKFTPFAYLRTDAFFTNPSFSGYQNDLAPQVAKIDDGFAGRVMPAIGLDYRYPFVANFGALGVHTLEPIGQIIARPSETRIGRLPNEDAQSLVFDDTSLFEWDKFSGYDRVEGGVRTNLGGQYSVVTPSGWYANVLFGESIQLAGVNSFRRGDIANTGLDSGLETQRSDFVGRFQVSPNQNITFISRARFNQADFHVARFETGVTARFAPFAPLTLSAFYSYYEAQPLLGYSHYREGVTASATYNITPNWFVSGSLLVDLTHYLDVRNTYTDALSSYLANPIGTVPIYQNPGRFYLSGASFGGGYQDECTTVSLNYINSPIATATGVRERNQTVLLRVELKTLGEADLRQNVGTATTADGIASVR
ncbi:MULTISPECIES: LPS-assembly protein LptD [Methylobacterium]|uniref:LPS-assembly protein LptD n=3 Tax=Methylobacterium TaxID=407 RepID=A0AAE8L6B5_9HYPH|nr:MULTISPECIES: LPS-assembly protein LptD [Methylobacterium]KOX51659.1 organic solvent tolerance protein [Streptomyces purpurogeneiscleroticus]AIQ88465.1 Organic solvent tolerance protein [Methylobacterium oryzae CBMB20]APT29423.1 LPS-assembly protein LptD [Methylobacterium phyllosphaerae]AWV18945.1 organic solvent tolerance protein [Methylobacterium sp. XJLW]MBA9062964.1 LPS-assembly protein [Methylobacterium fujisawaense]